MASYATVEDLVKGFRPLSDEEKEQASALLAEAAIVIDAYNEDSSDDAKKLVSCRLVRRQMGDGQASGLPIGATQGTMSALGYSQSWTVGSGAYGEMYLTKLDKNCLVLVQESAWRPHGGITMIATETVTLLTKKENGVDDFNAPIYEDVAIEVPNVIVGSPTFEDQVSDLNLSGKHLAFILGIPKGDTHDWEDSEIIIRGQKFKSYGAVLEQTEANVPLRWNKQVRVERYEQG